MNPFIQQLLDLFNSLGPAPGTSPEALRNLLRAQAAVLILQNPANAGIILPTDLDPIIVEAIQAGAAQAAALTAAGRHLRLVPEEVSFGTPVSLSPERRSERFGPFSDKAGQLARFVAIESPASFPSLFYSRQVPPSTKFC